MSTISIRAENGVERPSISYYKNSSIISSGTNVGNSTIGLNSLQKQFTAYTLSGAGDSEGTEFITGTTLTEGGLNGQQFSKSGFPTNSGANGAVTIPLSSPTVYSSIAIGDLGSNYVVIWIGYFKPPTSGTYTFYTASDDGSAVWIGDAALSETSTSADAVLNNNLGGGQGITERNGSTSLTGGTFYPIRILTSEGGGGAGCTFSWAGPSLSKTTDLSSYYYYTGNAGFGDISSIGPKSDVTTSTLSISFPQDIRTYNRDRTTIVSNKPIRSTSILANSIRASINVTGQVNTKLSDGSVVSGGGGGGGGGGSDSAVASTIKQIWY